MRFLGEQTSSSAKKRGTAVKQTLCKSCVSCMGVISPFQTAIKIEIIRKKKQLGKFEECVCQVLLRRHNSTLMPAKAFISVENTLGKPNFQVHT